MLSTIVSEKFIFLLEINKKESIGYLRGPLANLLTRDEIYLKYSDSKLSYAFISAWLNVKVIIHNNDHFSLATKQNACSFISILYGAFFGWCSYKALNKFFPSQ